MKADTNFRTLHVVGFFLIDFRKFQQFFLYQIHVFIKNQGKELTLLYFIAILQRSIGHPSSASIGGDFWLELVVRQMMFSRIPPKLCLQVALGCPRDLLPCGFHSNALWQI
jgi:hypothetical protein